MIFNKKMVIASHSRDEAITKSLTQNKHLTSEDITLVLLEELIHDYEIFDELSDNENIIRWKGRNDCVISNKTHYLLNRTLYFSKDLFSHFQLEDREYAQREFESYLGFAFNSFQGVGNKSPQGACEESIPLPWQWQKIHKTLNLAVPNYYWGPYSINPFYHKDSIVYSHIYNFLNWSDVSKNNTTDHVFCFEKPMGIPVFICMIGNKQLLTSELLLANEQMYQLSYVAQKAKEVLGCFICEILLFVNDDTITFGCVNPEIIRSCYNPNFNDFVYISIVSELCVHLN